MRIRILLVMAGLAAAVTAQADTRATMQETLDRYTPFAGEPVESFTFWSLHKWKPAGPTKLIVWPTIKEAYLVTVEEPCPRLEWARGIGLSSQQSHQVRVRTDCVETGGQRCRIEEIRKIDLEGMARAK